MFLFQDKLEHLELLDGVLIDLLKTKWNTFVKSHFYKQFYLFAFYFLFSLLSFTLRPGPTFDETETVEGQVNKTVLEEKQALIELAATVNTLKSKYGTARSSKKWHVAQFYNLSSLSADYGKKI